MSKKIKAKIDLDQILSSHSKNLSRINKPISKLGILSISAIIIAIIILLMIYVDCFSINQATVLGIVGATCISFFVLFFSVNKEKRDDYREARKAAKILSQLLESIESQISSIENGMQYVITYPSNWIDYYKSCSIYLQYDYLDYLLREFEIVEKINTCVNKKDFDGLSQMLKYRKKTITDWTFDFSILSVRFNLACFAIAHPEEKPWKMGKEYKEFKNFFLDNYSERTKELTIEFLKNSGKTCDANDAEYYVLEKIRLDPALKTGKYKYEVLENKKMLSVIFEVYLSLDKEGPFSLCWGELTLKD